MRICERVTLAGLREAAWPVTRPRTSKPGRPLRYLTGHVTDIFGLLLATRLSSLAGGETEVLRRRTERTGRQSLGREKKEIGVMPLQRNITIYSTGGQVGGPLRFVITVLIRCGIK